MSMQRECLVFKADNNKWYIAIGNREYSGLDDSTTYGPFDNEDTAYGELNYHSNPGSSTVNDDGTIPVPNNCQPPTRRSW